MKLKGVARLMQVLFLIGVLSNTTYADLNVVELLYDDGTAEAWGIGSTSPDMRFLQVVRFHSPWEGTQLLEAKLYIQDTIPDGQNALGYPCNLFVMDSNRVDIFVQEVIPSCAGWFSVDLKPHSIAVPTDFYVGVELTHSIQDIWGGYEYVPIVCFDSSDPDGESWWVIIPPSGEENWVHFEYYDMMIRAVISPLVATATIDIVPDTLNLQSKGRWITAYIEFPEDYDVSSIDISTVGLNGEIQAESHPTEVGDYDDNSIPDLMVKFDRVSVIDLFSIGEATLTITGKVNGIPFEGSDTIRVIGE